MASRSTRNKIRWQVQMATGDINRAMRHLQLLTEMAEGKSEYINIQIPRIVVMLDGVKTVLNQFRDGL